MFTEEQRELGRERKTRLMRLKMKFKNTMDKIKKYSVLEKRTGCWLWVKSVNRFNYGQMSYKNKTTLSHRVSYCESNQLELSSIEGLSVLHKCNNPSCVNPDHLYIGNQKENMKDMVISKNSLFGEKNKSAKLSKEKVLNIIEEYSTKTKTQKEISEKHGVSPSTVGSIVSGRTWSHV